MKPFISLQQNKKNTSIEKWWIKKKNILEEKFNPIKKYHLYFNG